MFNYVRKLIDYVPPYYDVLLESREILAAEDAEIARLNAEINDLLLQFNASTATWGLREWERIVGVSTDETKSIEERRSVVIAKLRGTGVVNAALVKSVAESFQGGELNVIEKNAEYKVQIEFVSTYGVPSNIDDLTAILREIIPAHLEIEYKFKYLTYNVVKASYKDYNALKGTGNTYQDLKDGVI